MGFGRLDSGGLAGGWSETPRLPHADVKKAFTLVELLVVLVIVAVLAAVALPAYENARISASQVIAVSALRQLGMAGQMYLADHNNVYWEFCHLRRGGHDFLVRV